MGGCVVVGLLVIFLFIVVPIPFWPFLVVGLILLAIIAAALGLLKGIFAAIFGRR